MEHERVACTVYVHVETVAEVVVVVDSYGVLGYVLAGICCVVAVVWGELLGGGFGFDDSGGSYCYFDGAVGVEAPVHDVVVVADYGGGAEDELPVGAAVDLAVFAVTPGGRVEAALEEAGHVGVELWGAGVCGEEGVKVGGVCGAIEANLEGLDEGACRVELAGVDEGAVVPAVGGVHVGNEEFADVAFVHDRAGLAFVDYLDEVEDGTDALV